MARMKNFWTCSNCHDEVEDIYDVCWNCQYDREGNLRVDLTEEVTAADSKERQALTEKYKDKNCVQCKTRLTYVGTKQFHEGLHCSGVPELAILFENDLELEMYYCPRCHRVEFFYFKRS